MCGGFALTIGLGVPGFTRNVVRQLVYSAGRVFTYSFLGVMAGYAGFWFTSTAYLWINAQATLSMIAGLLLAAHGLRALGFAPRRFRKAHLTGYSVCVAGRIVRPFLMSRRAWHIFVAGVLTGFLPCGLVYAFLALASSSASVRDGLTTMALFGAGTAPIMILAGAGGALLSRKSRRHLLSVSAVCVVLTGLISMVRGILFVRMAPAPEVVRCLFCGQLG